MDTNQDDALPEEPRPGARPGAPAAGGEAGTSAEAMTAPEEESRLDPREVEIIALTAERDELRERLLRALAEAENIRKRAERDRKEAEAYGGTRLARDLLSVHDNLARALAAIDESQRAAIAPVIEGIELTQRELLAAFQRNGIAKVAPAIGDRFDPNLHQAMFEAPVPNAEPGSIVQVIAEGFTIAGRLLRPAQVGVAARAPETVGSGRAESAS